MGPFPFQPEHLVFCAKTALFIKCVRSCFRYTIYSNLQAIFVSLVIISIVVV